MNARRAGVLLGVLAVVAAGCTSPPSGPGGGPPPPSDARQPIELAASVPLEDAAGDDEVIAALQTALGQPVPGELQVISRDGSALRVGQSIDGVPVIAGEAAVVVAADGAVSVVGEFTDTVPPPSGAIDVAQVAAGALGEGETLDAIIGVRVLDPTLVGRVGPVRTVVSIEVATADGRVRRSIDAIDGSVRLEEQLTHEALSRTICDGNGQPMFTGPTANSACGTTSPYPVVRTEGAPPSAVAAANLVYDYSGDTYVALQQLFGIDSFDRAGAPIISTVRVCLLFVISCIDNAWYDAASGAKGQFFYSERFISDDIVAHEIGHGVTQFSSRLIYSGESGGLNEAMSDIYGEVVDLRNGRGNDSAAVRWLIGEDAQFGVIRSMSNPPAYGDPDWIGSPLNQPGAGVHTLSGIPNKVFSLVADGGSFRGTSVPGQGVDNAARLFHNVNRRYLTPGASFSSFGAALRLACGDMVAAGSLPTSACGSVAAALTAVGIVSSLTSVPVTGDFDGDGRDDTLWYTAGPGEDALSWGGSRSDLGTGATRVAAGPVNGVYRPVAGDVDGDGRDDIVWYAAGSAPDFVWWGSSSRATFVAGGSSAALSSISGNYRPIAGDVDGDGRDDVLWYAPGGAADFVWWGVGVRSQFGATSTARPVGGDYWHAVGDVDGDGRDDVIWHAPGSAQDFVWWGGARSSFGVAGAPFSVNGAYRPVAGDVDGDGRDDLVWYAAGAASDHIWFGSSNRATFLAGGTTAQLAPVNGSYLPTIGDVDGDGPEDLQWFAPGEAADFRWFGSSNRSQFISGATSQRAFGL